MSKALFALLLPFLHFKLSFGDDDAAAAPQDAPATETDVAPSDAIADDEGTQPVDKPAEKTFTQEDLDKVVQKTKAKLERKAERERIELETRLKVSQEVQKAAPVSEDEPKVEDFEDYTQYLKALAKHTVKMERAAQEAESKSAESRKQQQSAIERHNAKQAEVWEAGNDKYDDFDEMANKTGQHLKSKGLSFAPEMLGALLETENAADIVHHLGVDLAEAERIARLTPYAQAKEIGKLEDKLSAKKPPKISSAPKPIAPIGSGTASAKSPEEMSVREYTEWRAKQGARWAR